METINLNNIVKDIVEYETENGNLSNVIPNINLFNILLDDYNKKIELEYIENESQLEKNYEIISNLLSNEENLTEIISFLSSWLPDVITTDQIREALLDKETYGIYNKTRDGFSDDLTEEIDIRNQITPLYVKGYTLGNQLLDFYTEKSNEIFNDITELSDKILNDINDKKFVLPTEPCQYWNQIIELKNKIDSTFDELNGKMTILQSFLNNVFNSSINLNIKYGTWNKEIDFPTLVGLIGIGDALEEKDLNYSKINQIAYSIKNTKNLIESYARSGLPVPDTSANSQFFKLLNLNALSVYKGFNVYTSYDESKVETPREITEKDVAYTVNVTFGVAEAVGPVIGKTIKIATVIGAGAVAGGKVGHILANRKIADMLALKKFHMKINPDLYRDMYITYRSGHPVDWKKPIIDKFEKRGLGWGATFGLIVSLIMLASDADAAEIPPEWNNNWNDLPPAPEGFSYKLKMFNIGLTDEEIETISVLDATEYAFIFEIANKFNSLIDLHAQLHRSNIIEKISHICARSKEEGCANEAAHMVTGTWENVYLYTTDEYVSFDEVPPEAEWDDTLSAYVMFGESFDKNNTANGHGEPTYHPVDVNAYQ